MNIKYILLAISLLGFVFSQCENPNEKEYFIECGGGALEEQVIWALSPGNLQGGAPYTEIVCLPDGLYNLMMSDLGNNGWNGNTWIISERLNQNMIVECTLDSGNFDSCPFILGEVEECSDYFGESACDNDEICEWVEDIETTSCTTLSQTECNMTPGCWWDCTDWGDWYTWICYGTYACMGGTFEDDNSYCNEIDFLNGDTNLDHTINIQDVLVLINLILSNESGYNSDVNDDGIINVLDIIELVEIILNN